jgi:hypothetical protein
MQLDRARFLHLVSAIASATACAPQKTEPEPVYVPMQPAATASVAPIATAPLAVPPPMASTAKASEGRSPAPPDAPLAAGGTGIWTLPYDPAATPKTCGQLKCPLGAPWQEAARALASQCKQLDAALKPEVFQRFMTCMMQQNNTRGTCDLARVGTDPGECLERWTETPNVDPATAAKCKPIVSTCAGPNRSVHSGGGTLTMQACQQMLSIAKPRAEAKMIHCVTEYCDDAPRLCYLGM